MKSLAQSWYVSDVFEGVCLYRDDLERIIGLLRDGGFSIVRSDGSFQYDSIDALQKAQGNFPRKLRIEAKPPSYSTWLPNSGQISLSNWSRVWAISSFGEETYGVAREIEAIVKARQSVLEHIPLLGIFPLGVSLLGISFAIRAILAPLSYALIGLGALGCCFLAGLAAWLHFRPRIVLKYKHEAGLFHPRP